MISKHALMLRSQSNRLAASYFGKALISTSARYSLRIAHQTLQPTRLGPINGNPSIISLNINKARFQSTGPNPGSGSSSKNYWLLFILGGLAAGSGLFKVFYYDSGMCIILMSL